MKTNFIKSMFVNKPGRLAAFIFMSITFSLRADVIFDSFSTPNTSVNGYMNTGTQWGDEITLAGTSPVLNSISFQVSSFYGTYNGPSTFTLALWDVNPGTDGFYQTADDTMGTQIFSQDYPNVTIANNTAVTLGGFSVAVPQNFIYTITDGDNLSYLISFTSDSTFTGGSANQEIMWWDIFSGTLDTGAPAAYYTFSGIDFNPLTQITGTITPTPEPTTLAFAGLGGLSLLLFRRRKI
jgi:hypothetical protein